MNKDMNVIIGALSAAMLSLAALPAQAVGANIVKLFTVSDTVLGGYVATPPAGWKVGYQFNPGSLSTAPVQEIFAMNFAQGSGSSTTTVPPAIYITRFSSKGLKLSSDALPADVQVTQADCTFPNYSVNPVVYNGCQSIFAYVTLSPSNPARMIVMVT